MAKSERESLQKRIVQFYLSVANRKKNLTVNHFLNEKIPRRIIYNVITKYEECDHIGDKKRSGRSKEPSSKHISQLKNFSNHNTDISWRLLASKFRVSHEIIRAYLKDMNIKYYKKQRAQKYTDQQLQEVPIRARRLYRTLGNNDLQIIMDDEKYFLLSDQSVPTNRGYYSCEKSLRSPEVRFKRTQKFEQKLLLWIAISTNGISPPFFAKQRQTINEKTYLEECIIKPLVPFIDSYQDKDKTLFWPDLASSHYSNIVTSYLSRNGIQFVDRYMNPENCPQSRPIETLWSILKNMLYDQGWGAKNIDHLKRRKQQKIKETDIDVVQSKFSGIRKQLRKIADHEPYHAYS